MWPTFFCIEFSLIKKQVNTLEILDKSRDVYEGLVAFSIECSVKIDKNVQPVTKP